VNDRRTPAVLVCGWTAAAAAAATSLNGPGTVLVHHDLRDLGEGVVRRTITTTDADGVPREHVAVLELAHGCVSCTLREDLLPLLRRLHARGNVRRIVLLADPALEPAALCWAIENVMVTDVVGQIDGPAGRDVRIEAVLTCIDAATWLADASGDETLLERGLVSGVDDDRTVAQVAVAQVDYADALIVTGSAADAWHGARLQEVLIRLAPGAPIAWTDGSVDTEMLLARIPATARRGRTLDPHASLLRGQPPLEASCGVAFAEFAADRPFHPQRLHEAIDYLLDGVITARGRLWFATQPDEVLWLESAGGGLRVAAVGKWLAAMSPAERERESLDRRALAALRWDAEFGDRNNAIVALVHNADPADITEALRWALLTDAELAQRDWSAWDDPFGQFHEEPCEPDLTETSRESASREGSK
jgi:G3E family GTPase